MDQKSKRKLKIYLTGMPGSGKSTLGKEVARQLKLPFLDLDKAIEQQCAKSVTRIFEEEGEAYFRKEEAALLRELSENNSAFVMATGGGVPCYFNGIDYINTQGISIFINVPAQALLDRLLAYGRDDRPLLKGAPPRELLYSLQEKLEKRLPFYKNALVELSGTNLQAADIMAALREIYPGN